MKKLIILLAIVFTGITAADAGNGDKKINSLISKNLKVPSSLKNTNLNEKVNVQFKIAETGKATVISVETENSELKNYIINQFPKIDFNNATDKQEGLYFIDINFKVL